VSIPVADQDRALAFYTEQLGFRVVTDQPFDDKQRWLEQMIPNAETHVVLFTPEEQRDRIGTHSHVTFWSGDVSKTYQQLRAKGVEFIGEPSTQDWRTAAIFKDSEGNVYVLSSR
jgi:catechol 2,3-dioxygenase-like lactoylglutathione lyase family enzyme